MQEYLQSGFSGANIQAYMPDIQFPLKLLKTIKKVNAFPRFTEGKIYFFDIKESLIVLEEKSLKELSKKKCIDTNFPDERIDFIISGKYLACTVLDDFYVIDHETFKVETLLRDATIDLSICTIEENAILGTRLSEEEEEPVMFIYDIVSNSFILEKDFEELSIGVSADGDSFYLDNEEDALFAFSKSTGALKWRFEFGEIGKFKTPHETVEHGRASGASIIYGNTVIVPVYGYEILGIDKESGVLKWRLKTALKSTDNIQLSENTLYVLGYKGYYEIDPNTGNVLKHYPLGDATFVDIDFTMPGKLMITTTHVIAVDGYTGVLIALNKATGNIDFTYEIGESVPLDYHPLVINGRLYVLDTEKRLHIFEPA